MINSNLNNDKNVLLILAVIFFVLTLFCLNIFLSPPDTAAYYSVARSIIIDYDMNFSNEYEQFNFLTSMFWVTPAGYLSNDWPIGTGILLAPFLFIAHIFIMALKLFFPTINADGYNSAYQIFAALGMVFAAFIGFWAVVSFLRQFAKPKIILISIFFILFGSPLAFYLFYANFMSHIPGFVFVSLFILLWSETLKERSKKDWMLLGLLLGISAIIRPQNILVGAVLIPEIIFNLFDKANRKIIIKDYVWGILFFIIFCIIGFLPQFIFWGKIYGNFFQFPKIDEMDWFSPHIISMIFSDYHGILLWTPIVILSLPGLLIICKKNKIIGYSLILFAVLEFYVNAANKIWWASGSLGNRRLVDASLVFIAAAAVLLSENKLRFLHPLFILCVLWTLLLVSAERAQVITLEHYEAWNKKYFLQLINYAANPFKVVMSLKGSYGEMGLLGRFFSAILLLGLILFIVHFKDKFIKNFSSNSFKHPKYYLIYIWIMISVIFSICVMQTRKPDLSIVINKLNYKNISLWHNYYEMGFFYLCKKQYDKSEKAFLKAVEIQPHQPMPYRYLASIYGMTNRPLIAMKYAEKAVELFPDYQAAKDELKHIYEYILKIYPEDFLTKKKLEKLNEDLKKTPQ